MIDYRELMIGNYVLYNGHEATVYGIMGPMPFELEIWNNKPIITLSCNGLITATEDELEPIPVTKEVLERFWFKYDHLIGSWKTQAPVGIFNVYFSRGKLWSTNTRNATESVHQLQNLFFITTGIQLTPQNKPSDNVDSRDSQSD